MKLLHAFRGLIPEIVTASPRKVALSVVGYLPLVSSLVRLRHPLAHRYWRSALARRNLDYFVWRYVTNGSRTLSARLTRLQHLEARRIGKELRQQGIAMGPAEGFLSGEGRQVLAEASTMVLGLTRRSEVQATLARTKSDQPKEYLIPLMPGPHMADSPLLRLALDVKLLEIVSSYFGMWPRLYSVAAWLNFPTDTEAKSAQLWHRDPEDLQVVKVFIYLVDVDESRGPFCYIPGTQPLGPAAANVPPHKDRTRVSDAEMSLAFPPESWRTCTGPANTMILADTVGYHRGGKPRNGYRILITFTFTSGRSFKGREFSIAGTPTWITDRIQWHAL